MKASRRLLMLAGILVAFTLVAAACGSDDDDGESASFSLVSGGTLTVCTDSPYPPMEFEQDGEFTGFDIVFHGENDDGDIDWNGVEDTSSGDVDIIGVAVHEFGHALGLDHTGVVGATMRSFITGTGIGARTLTSDDIDGAIIASVVPQTMHALNTLCSRYFKVTPLVVGEPGTITGIEVRIARPDQVGADRLVNGIAAFAEHGGPLIVIDFGTATTFDVIGADGAYEGGVIAPGINLSLEALDRAAAKLPRIAIKEPPQQVIGQATIPAMESGAYWGYVGLIEGLVARIKGEYGQPMKVVATGGLAPLFSRATECIEEIDPDLTLRGLLAIYRANREAGS